MTQFQTGHPAQHYTVNLTYSAYNQISRSEQQQLSNFKMFDQVLYLNKVFRIKLYYPFPDPQIP